MSLIMSLAAAGGAPPGFSVLSGSPTGYWLRLAMSADGTKMAVGNYAVASKIWTSVNSGLTWTEQAASPNAQWNELAMSSDGTKLIGTVRDDGLGASNGYIMTSTDSGANWTSRTDPGKQVWQGCGISSDGTKMVACSAGTGNGTYSNSYPYTSTDSGASWVARSALGAGFYEACAISDDGQKLLITKLSGGGYYSLNNGASFTAATGTSSARAAAISADGTKMLFGRDGGGGGAFSLNSGTSWTAVPAPAAGHSVMGVAISDSGAIMYLGANGGAIYQSIDSGVSFKALAMANAWGVNCTADGLKAIAAKASDSQVYRFGY